MADETKPPEAANPAAATATKPAPPKPAAAAKSPAKAGKDRRSFLFVMFGTAFGIAWMAFTAAMTAMTLWMARFMFPNVPDESRSTFRAGKPGEFDSGQVVERFKQDFGVWIVRLDNTLFALSTTCTHLGCTPNWLEAEQKFKCPCHGSGFRKDGTNFEGPAPRPLERYKIGRADDGQILVDKSKKFQKELGQWSDPDAFLTV